MIWHVLRLRPYHDEYTRSRLITEVKHRRAGIVLGWGTAWELPVPQAFGFSFLYLPSKYYEVGRPKKVGVHEGLG